MCSPMNFVTCFGIVISLTALINADSVMWGKIRPDHLFLRRERLHVNAIIRQTTEADYKFPRKWDDNEFPLTAIKVMDFLPDKGTVATITKGGLNKTFVTLHFKSAWEEKWSWGQKTDNGHDVLLISVINEKLEFHANFSQSLEILTCLNFLMTRVEAETQIWGSVEFDDVYLRREAINVPAKSGESGEFEYVFPRENEVNKFTINSIRAFDNDLENESSVSVVDGGLGSTTAKLLIKSAMDRGIDFVIEFYGQPL